MGCQSCKIYENVYVHIDNDEIRQGTRYTHLLKPSERNIWMKSLYIAGLPNHGIQHQLTVLMENCEHPAFKQVKKDVARSFPTTQFFNEEPNLSRFENLLKKFVLYFPKIGYTQGLNFVAGYFLLAGFNQTDAFQCLIRLSLHEKLMMIGMYQDSFPLNKFYCALFWKLLEVKIPKVANKLRKASVPDQIWIFQWFISFFLSSFPVQFVKGMWDFIICRKDFSMVFLALGIVKCLKRDILAIINPDQVDFFQFFDNLKEVEFCEQKVDLRKAINYANSITKHELVKALEEIEIPSSVYKVYFMKEDKQRQIWITMNKKLQQERERFRRSPSSPEYDRDIDTMEHLDRLIRQKSQLYKSKTDSKYSSMFRTSNFTIDRSTKNEPQKPRKEEYNAPKPIPSKKQENKNDEKARSPKIRPLHLVDHSQKTSLGSLHHHTQNLIHLNSSSSLSVFNAVNRSPPNK